MTTTQVRAYQGPAPTTLAAAAVGSGGTFAAGAQFWKVTALGAWGEGGPSNEATVSVALNGSANLTWVNPAGTTGVKVYRGTGAGAENVLVATLPAVQAFTDTNLNAGAASPPAAVAWGAVAKSGAQPTKANVPGGTNPGRGNMLMQALSSWTQGADATHGGTGPLAAFGRKEAVACGFQLQDV